MTIAKTLTFVDWLARVRKLKATTINSYLAGVRQLHVVRGLEPPLIRSGLVLLVLKDIALLKPSGIGPASAAMASVFQYSDLSPVRR